MSSKVNVVKFGIKWVDKLSSHNPTWNCLFNFWLVGRFAVFESIARPIGQSKECVDGNAALSYCALKYVHPRQKLPV
jgi:hypothetical protein